jgi:hypothetical protein
MKRDKNRIFARRMANPVPPEQLEQVIGGQIGLQTTSYCPQFYPVRGPWKVADDSDD